MEALIITLLMWRFQMGTVLAHKNTRFSFKRTQFFIKLSFVMTKIKFQGHKLDFVRVYLLDLVFSYRQLYVALSRARISSWIKFLIRATSSTTCNQSSTTNIVNRDLLTLVGISWVVIIQFINLDSEINKVGTSTSGHQRMFVQLTVYDDCMFSHRWC